MNQATFPAVLTLRTAQYKQSEIVCHVLPLALTKKLSVSDSECLGGWRTSYSCVFECTEPPLFTTFFFTDSLIGLLVGFVVHCSG